MKTKAIPSWVCEVRIIGNGIDGWPPQMPERLSVEDFLSQADALGHLDGAGEWDAIVYGLSVAGVDGQIYHPYGAHNSYKLMRSTDKCTVVKLGYFSYMHDPIKFRRGKR